MKSFDTVFSDRDDCYLTIANDPADPCSWVLRRWKKRLFMKKRLLSLWFATREQAEAHARALLKECDG